MRMRVKYEGGDMRRRRRRAITEDGDDNDEDGVDCVGHFVIGRTS